MNEICYLPATEVAARVRRRELAPTEIIEAFLDRIDDRDDAVNAYVTVIEKEARKKAREAEAALDREDPLGPLHGVPIALKDALGFKKGVRHTYGSIPFKDNIADRDALFVQRLEQAGAIVLGKTNVPEFGSMGTTDNRLFGPTSTPFDLQHNAGGSSGGSAAAVADGLCTMAQGSDAGGSLRIPASFCGVYTLKPSFRRVAAPGVPNAFSSSKTFGHFGPLTRTVQDAALMLEVIAKPHPRDPFCVPSDDTDFLGATRTSIDGLDIAYTSDYGLFPVDERVTAVTDNALAVFEQAGATVSEVELELDHSHDTLTDAWLDIWRVNYAAEMELLKEDAGIDLLGDHRDALTEPLIRLIEGGQDTTGTEYYNFDIIRTEVLNAVAAVFEDYDLLVAPTVACPPVENAADELTVGPTEINGETIEPTIGWCMTYLMNFTGHPAASLPVGQTDDGLPIGMQITGRRFADKTVLAASAAFERIRPWYDTYPPR